MGSITKNKELSKGEKGLPPSTIVPPTPDERNIALMQINSDPSVSAQANRASQPHAAPDGPAWQSPEEVFANVDPNVAHEAALEAQRKINAAQAVAEVAGQVPTNVPSMPQPVTQLQPGIMPGGISAGVNLPTAQGNAPTLVTPQAGATVYNPPNPAIPMPPKPPSTRAEYERQFTYQNGEFPEVTDLFTGNVPQGMQPDAIVHFPPVGPPVIAAAAPPVQVIVEHRIPDQALAYKFTRAAHMQLDGSFHEWKANDIIYDVSVIQQILRSGFDGLVPLEVAKNFTECPMCHHQFPVPLAAK
jgi:hypothetical protein